LTGQPDEKRPVAVRFPTALNEALQRAEAAVFVDRGTLAEPGFDHLLVFALKRGRQQQIKKTEKNRRTQHE